MICSACHTVYSPSEKELGKVETLAGLCDKCGRKPHFLPFAIAFIEAAVVSLISIEFVIFVFLSGSAQAALALAGAVIFICIAIYLYARQSTIVRYANEREKKAATWPHRLFGMVFGTGTHPTTQDCLMAVQLALAKDRVGCVLDLGTGTGLLALAAVRLGGETCVALDLNRLAVETAWRNVRLNKMTGQILVVQGDAKNFMDLPCDLMISNIHYDVMRYFLAGNGLWSSKQFILSGLLHSQARKIEARLMNGPAIILEKWERDGIWTTFYGETTGR